MRIHHKAYVYLTCGPELLVFSEPDFPEVGLQVPGGTLDPSESYLQGAIREFTEETGLLLDVALEPFADQDHIAENVPECVRGLHRRRFFHGQVREKPAEQWDHFEKTPSSGGPPIRFRLFWINLFDDTTPDISRFLQEFGTQLDFLRSRLERQINGCH